ncbi:hypothetical protein CDD80_3461 [Ophiocordyceps camponoti-rufipedis]|uniref:F-box domain-containing protein n=1 Tax=Ophiocordyceps camponoti-rufipedis TaxID=2004952 RepID=A0A2C5YYU2_9HYPO|nr:hypothetical protein CDD80_3461 [Ophiocordyceps camponoti-rufipedis]
MAPDNDKTWPEIERRAAASRYRLSREVKLLLSALHRYHIGRLDIGTLRGMVALDSFRRSEIADTIRKCGRMMKVHPRQSDTSLSIIRWCLELHNITDQGLPPQTFPIMRLPPEIRENVLRRVISDSFIQQVVPARDFDCGCPCAKEEHRFRTDVTKALPTLLSTVLRDEYLRVFYRSKTFRFRCTCELLHYLLKPEFSSNVSSLSVHWCGGRSSEAFALLAKCPRLKSLELGVSKVTNNFLSDRAKRLKEFFPSNYRTTRIVDVNGLEELLEIRGLKSARAVRVSRLFVLPEAVEAERSALHNMMKDRLTT